MLRALLILLCAVPVSAADAGAWNLALDGGGGYRTNVFVAVDSSVNPTLPAYRNSPFVSFQAVPSYSLRLKKKWTGKVLLDLSSTYYSEAYTTASLMPGFSLEHGRPEGRFILRTAAGFSMRPPDEQQPDRPAQALVASCAANYIFKRKFPVDLGYVLDLLQDVTTSRADIANTLKAKVSLNVNHRLRLLGRLGLIFNTSTDALSRYTGIALSPGAIFIPSENNSFFGALFLEHRTYEAASQQNSMGLTKMPFYGGNSRAERFPHALGTDYVTFSTAYVRDLSETLDFSCNYGVALFFPGNNSATVVSHKISAELSWVLRPL